MRRCRQLYRHFIGVAVAHKLMPVLCSCYANHSWLAQDVVLIISVDRCKQDFKATDAGPHMLTGQFFSYLLTAGCEELWCALSQVTLSGHRFAAMQWTKRGAGDGCEC